MRWVLAAALFSACWTTSKPEPAKPAPVEDLIQPVKIEKEEYGVEGGEEGGEEGGDPCGVAGGVVGGVIGGTSAPPPPPPPPPPPAPSQNVPPTLLEMNRIAGDKNIVPEDATKTAIAQSGKDKIIGAYKLCLTETGNVSSVSQLKSTGFTDYDQKIMTEMRSNWRYRPYVVNGNAIRVCTAVTFIYSQTAPTPPPRP